MEQFQSPVAWKEAIRLINQALSTGRAHLSLSGLRLRTLPPDIKSLKHQLTSLDLSNMKTLKNVDALNEFTSLVTLNLNECSMLISLNGISGLRRLKTLNLGFCNELFDLDELSLLAELETLKVSDVKESFNSRVLQELDSLRNLEVLNFNKSSLESLSELTNLNSLKINGGENLKSVSGISKLKGLQTLEITECQELINFEELSELIQLQTLDLFGCNKLKSLDFLSNLAQLRTLDVSNCSELPGISWLSRMTNLHTLSMRWCDGIGDFEALSGLKNINVLDIGGCTGLRDLKVLSNLVNLRSLDIGGCHAVTNLDDISELVSLNELNLSECNALTSLDVVSGFIDLYKLDLSGCNSLTSISFLSGFTNLQDLDLSGCNSLTNLDALSEVTNLQKIKLIDCNLLTTLDIFSGLEKLQMLNVSGCVKLRSLHGLSELTKLDSLQAERCVGLRNLDNLSGLNNLHTLNLSLCHKLKSLDDLPELKGLRKLYLHGCIGLRSIGVVSQLKDLHELHMFGCLRVRDWHLLSNLKSLVSLDISYCTGVTNLDWMYELTKLRKLHIADCNNLKYIKFSQLEYILYNFPSIDSFLLDNVSIPTVPYELTKQVDLVVLEDWYFDVQQGHVKPDMVKLHFLGNGRVGKTQISRRLTGQGFDESIPSTHGIIINEWTLKDAIDTTVSNWDFGGQDIYLSTHSLFLDERAIYCLVWHPDYENNEKSFEYDVPMQNHYLSYWLAYIHSLAGNEAPIIVTQSKCDYPKDYVNAPIPNPQPFKYLKSTEASAKSDEGLELLEPLIKRAIQRQKERFGEAILPISWSRVQEKLECEKAKGVKKISKRRYLDFCGDEHSIEAVSAPDSLLSYLHNSGQVFYKKELFNNDVILDQGWALKGVYSLLERGTTLPALKSLQGRFTKALMDQLLWDREGYTEGEKKLFIQMMEQCGICFKVSDDNYIAPDCLPDIDEVSHRIKTLWRSAETDISVKLSYEFLHLAVARHVLCRIGEQAGGDGIYWRYGCCYYDDKTKATVLIKMTFNQGYKSDNFGQPGEIIIQANGAGSDILLKHLVNSIKTSLTLSKSPSIEWVKKSNPNTEINKTRKKEEKEAFSMVSTATKLPKVYISYAWGSADDEHQQVSDAIYNALHSSPNFQVLRDKEELKAGDSIKTFEKRIGWANHIVVIYSEKSLKSDDCMRELAYIKSTSTDKKHFQQRVIPIVLNSVNIGRITQRKEAAKYWNEELKVLEEGAQEYADSSLTNGIKLYRDIKDSLMSSLDWSNDVVLTRDQGLLKEEGYKTVIGLLKKRIKKMEEGKDDYQ